MRAVLLIVSIAGCTVPVDGAGPVTDAPYDAESDGCWVGDVWVRPCARTTFAAPETSRGSAPAHRTKTAESGASFVQEYTARKPLPHRVVGVPRVTREQETILAESR